jgi:hypothetical protein
MLKIIILRTTFFPFRGYYPHMTEDAVSHASGARPGLARSATTTLGCAAARRSHPAHTTAGRLSGRRLCHLTRRRLLLVPLFALQTTFPGYPGPALQQPMSPLRFPLPPAQPGLRAKPRDQSVVLSHTRPACSPLPGRTRVHHRLLCEERNHRDTAFPTTYTA